MRAKPFDLLLTDFVMPGISAQARRRGRAVVAEDAVRDPRQPARAAEMSPNVAWLTETDRRGRASTSSTDDDAHDDRAHSVVGYGLGSDLK